jgi:UDP-N-acetylmuramate dehydrogenase
MIFSQNISLKKYNTFGIEAIADYYTELDNLSQIPDLLGHELFVKQPMLVLGGGSNILFIENFKGLVIKVLLKGIDIVQQDDHYAYVKGMAGENWEDLVEYCISHQLGGLENLTLIPGCVGASPMQNIGAYGKEVKDTFHSLEALDIASGEIRSFTAEECRFGYRDSYFKQQGKNKFIILSVTFRLTRHGHILNIGYGDVKKVLEEQGVQEPGITDVMNAIRMIRQSKLPDPAEIGNSGSFFKNPVIDAERFEKLHGQWPDIPGYKDAVSGRVKTAAGWLIEKAGWKGFREGDAGVHPKQALVLVNYGTATGMQILNLANRIRLSVLDKFGIDLETEVNIIGTKS